MDRCLINDLVDILEVSTCNDIVSAVRRVSDLKKAEISVHIRGSVATSYVQEKTRNAYVLTRSELSREIDLLENRVSEIVVPQIGAPDGFDAFEMQGSQIILYPEGGYYRTHVDATYESRRILTVLIYLTEDFSGGETKFPYVELVCTPRTGSGLVFPSTMWHSAEPTHGGTKVVFVTWLCRPDLPIWI